jgi:hypothetical protein
MVENRKRDWAGLRIVSIVLLIIALIIIIGVPTIRKTLFDRIWLPFKQAIVKKTVPPSKKIEEKIEKIMREKMPAKELETQLKESLDHVVTKEESFQVKGERLSIAEILRSAGIKEAQGDLLYGVKVIQAGDDVWSIHYKVLREFFKKEGIALPPQADKPNGRGYSSGTGKILKYDEKKAYIYNIQNKRLRSGDIHLIYPGEEILFFSMKDVFSHLRGKDFSFLNRLYFDGDNLYIVHSDGSKELLTQD